MSIISKYRVYVDSEDEVPDKYEVQHGDQGGIYYEVESGGGGDDDDDGDTQASYNDDPTSYTHIDRLREAGYETGDYKVNSEFGGRVADAVNNDRVVQEVAANEWMSYAGTIDDEDLLVDALEQITEDGTKTARERVRRRLRGLGWDSDEIDDVLRGDTLRSRFEEGDLIRLEAEYDDGEELAEVVGFTSLLDEDKERLKVELESGKRRTLDEDTFEEFFLGSGEDVDFAELRTLTIPEPSQSEGIPDEVGDIWKGMTDDELREFAATAGVDDPLDALETYAQNELQDMRNPSEADQEVMDLLNEWAAGYIDDDEAEHHAEQLIAEYSNELGLGDDSPQANMARAMLWYRGDEDIEVDDFIEIQTNRVEREGDDSVVDPTREGIKDALDKMDPRVGAYAAAGTNYVTFWPQAQFDSSSTNGHHTSSGKIRMSWDHSGGDRRVARTAAHEFGHQTHNMLGLEKQFNSYPDSGEWRNFDRDNAVFGIKERDDPKFDELKKFHKNWERYQDGDTDEIRPYQRRHGVEHLAVTFGHWTEDEAKLQGRDPFMKQFWDVHAGGAERVDIDGIDDLEPGDEVIVDAGLSTPELVEFDERYEGANEFKGFPKGAGGKGSDPVPYSGREIVEGTVIRHE